MYVCMYVCMCVCMYGCTNVCIYVYMYIEMYAFKHAQMFHRHTKQSVGREKDWILMKEVFPVVARGSIYMRECMTHVDMMHAVIDVVRGYVVHWGGLSNTITSIKHSFTLYAHMHVSLAMCCEHHDMAQTCAE